MQRLLALLSIWFAAFWRWVWDGIKGMVFERGVDMATPLIGPITLDLMIAWGPPFILLFLGAWLFWKTRPRPHEVDGDAIEEGFKIRQQNITTIKNSPVIRSSGNITVGHIGDLTINQALQPELIITFQGQRNNDDGTITVSYEAEIASPYPPGSLFIDAQAEGILGIDAIPRRAGTQFLGHVGTRADHAFTTIMHPFGKYILNIHLKLPTKIIIEYVFDA